MMINHQLNDLHQSFSKWAKWPPRDRYSGSDEQQRGKNWAINSEGAMKS